MHCGRSILAKGHEDDADDYWSLSRQWIPRESDYETKLDIINYHFLMGGEHRYAWDEETLAKELLKAGFVSLRIEFNPSFHLEARRHGTLYMQARRLR